MTRTLAVILAASLALLPTDGIACTCLPSTVQSAWNNADHVFAGTIVRSRTVGGWNVYSVRVQRDGKSCLSRGQLVQLAAPVVSSTCGIAYRIGDSKLFFANTQSIAGARRMVTNACSGNRDLSSLTTDDVDWLRTRYLSCANSCLDPSVPLLNCLIDPCTVTPACAAGTCVANYCGGCNAEFYDVNGYQVCVP